MSAAEGLWPAFDESAADAGATGEPADPAEASGDEGGSFFFASDSREDAAAAASSLFSDAGEADTVLFGGADPETKNGASATADAAMMFSSSEREEGEEEQDPQEEARPSHHRLSVRAAEPRAVARRERTEAFAVGQLAHAVDGLRALEHRMATTLAAAERTLRTLGARPIYEGAGYSSFAEIQARMLRTTPMLQALRVSVRRPSLVPPAGARAGRSQNRSTRALMTISRVVARLRSLEDQIAVEARQAHDALAVIEREHLFDECGYTSFEDFLERALGPSPLLSSAVALIGERLPPSGETSVDERDLEPDQEPEAAPRREQEPDPEPEAWLPARPPSMPAVPRSTPPPIFPEAEPPQPEAERIAVEPAPEAAPVAVRRRAVPRRVAQVGLTILLALVATAVGATVGRFDGHDKSGPDAPDASVLGLTASAVAAAHTPELAKSSRELGRATEDEKAPRRHASEPRSREPGRAREGVRPPLVGDWVTAIQPVGAPTAAVPSARAQTHNDPRSELAPAATTTRSPKPDSSELHPAKAGPDPMAPAAAMPAESPPRLAPRVAPRVAPARAAAPLASARRLGATPLPGRTSSHPDRDIAP